MASTENVRCTGKKRNLGEISVENCQYRGEGNSSIVITLKKEEKVLRLKKSSSVIEDANSNTEESIKKSHLQADFIKHVMRGLLGHYYVPSPELVPITNEEIELVNRAIHEERPAYRCKKTIPEDTSFGLLLPDFCTLPSHLRNYTEGPVLAVEIKPKQGFLPPSYWLSKDNQVKSTICRFHLVQQYKKKKGLLSACSTYCPLDLFSGCSTRMNQAVRQLLLHPQNNLRIFKNKELIFSEEHKSDLDSLLADFIGPDVECIKDVFCELLVDCLCYPLPTTDRMKIGRPFIPEVGFQSCLMSSVCCCTNKNRINHRLPKGCVLDRILQIQCICSMDITSIYPFYSKLKQTSSGTPTYTKYFDGQLPAPVLPRGVGKVDRQDWESEETFACRKVWEFLVALTAKDCSIMFAFQRLSSRAKVIPKDRVIEDRKGQKYVISFAIVDLDPKSVSKLEKIYQEDSNMVNML